MEIGRINRVLSAKLTSISVTRLEYPAIASFYWLLTLEFQMQVQGPLIPVCTMDCEGWADWDFLGMLALTAGKLHSGRISSRKSLWNLLNLLNTPYIFFKDEGSIPDNSFNDGAVRKTWRDGFFFFWKDFWIYSVYGTKYSKKCFLSFIDNADEKAEDLYHTSCHAFRDSLLSRLTTSVFKTNFRK